MTIIWILVADAIILIWVIRKVKHAPADTELWGENNSIRNEGDSTTDQGGICYPNPSIILKIQFFIL